MKFFERTPHQPSIEEVTGKIILLVPELEIEIDDEILRFAAQSIQTKKPNCIGVQKLLSRQGIVEMEPNQVGIGKPKWH